MIGYEHIINPSTGKSISIHGVMGKRILANYVNTYQYGGSTEEKYTDNSGVGNLCNRTIFCATGTTDITPKCCLDDLREAKTTGDIISSLASLSGDIGGSRVTITKKEVIEATKGTRASLGAGVWTLGCARALKAAIQAFDGGKSVVNKELLRQKVAGTNSISSKIVIWILDLDVDFAIDETVEIMEQPVTLNCILIEFLYNDDVTWLYTLFYETYIKDENQEFRDYVNLGGLTIQDINEMKLELGVESLNWALIRAQLNLALLPP